jgi:hypothetical protein
VRKLPLELDTQPGRINQQLNQQWRYKWISLIGGQSEGFGYWYLGTYVMRLFDGLLGGDGCNGNDVKDET